MYVYNKCKFCSGGLPKVATTRNAFCSPQCRALYSKYSHIDRMVLNPYRNEILDCSLGDRTDVTVPTGNQRITERTTMPRGTKQQPSFLDLLGDDSPILTGESGHTEDKH